MSEQASPNFKDPNERMAHAREAREVELRRAKQIAQAAFLEHLRTGLPVQKCARACSLAYSTFRAWRQDDPEFAAAWDDAREEGLDNVEALVLKAATTDWRAAEAYLKAQRPETWGRQKVDASVNATVAAKLEADVTVAGTLKVDLPRAAATWLESIADASGSEGALPPPLQN